MRKNLALPFLAAIAFLFSGCVGNPPAENPAAPPGAQSGPIGQQETLTLTGSVAALPLMLALSEGFQAEGGAVRFEVSASGARASIDALSAGEAPLAMFEGSESDVPPGAASDTVAYMGATAVVNPSCGIMELSPRQITGIFTGESDDWSDFGGSGKITLIVPAGEDAFRQLFEETFSVRAEVNGILRSAVPDAAIISENVMNDVAATPGAIGIVPAGSLSSAESAVSVGGVFPSADALQDGSYPAGRVILLAVGANAAKSADDFLIWCRSEKARKLIEDTGFTPIR